MEKDLRAAHKHQTFVCDLPILLMFTCTDWRFHMYCLYVAGPLKISLDMYNKQQDAFESCQWLCWKKLKSGFLMILKYQKHSFELDLDLSPT